MLDKEELKFSAYFQNIDNETYCFYIAQNFFQVINMNNLLWNSDSFYKCKIIFINFIVENQDLLNFVSVKL